MEVSSAEQIEVWRQRVREQLTQLAKDLSELSEVLGKVLEDTQLLTDSIQVLDGLAGGE